MQVALDLLGVANGVRQEVAQEDEPEAEGHSDQEALPRHLPFVRPHGSQGRARPLDDTRVVRADGGRDVALVQLLQEHVVQAGRGLGFFLEDLDLGGLLAVPGRLGLLGIDGVPELALPLLELGELHLEPVGDLGRPLLLGLLDLRDLVVDLLDLGVALLVLLLEARELHGEGRDLGVEPRHHGVRGHLGDGVQVLAGLAHLRELLEGRLDADAPCLGGHVVLVELADGGGHRRATRRLGHEHVLALVGLGQLVLGLAHAFLGLAQALLQPVVGLLRRLHAAGQGLLDVDLGQGVGPEGGLLRVLVGHRDRDQPALGYGLHSHVGHEERPTFRVVLEGRTVVELEPLHHPAAQGLGFQHPELRVVEIGVLPVVAHPGQGVGDGHEGRGGGLDLDHGPRAVLGRLEERDHEAEAETHEAQGHDEDPAPPDEARVVAQVQLALRSGVEDGRGGGHGRVTIVRTASAGR